MSTANIVSLVVMTLLFAVWAAGMFAMLWRVTKHAHARLNETGGGYFTWLGHALSAMGVFLTSEEDRPSRRRLILLTALLFAVIVARPLWLTP